MVFDVSTLIWHRCQYMQLDPGDLLLTGTPKGIALPRRFPYLRAGDSCEVEIDGLGHRAQKFEQA
jgi:2,4-diketo-3-deoxy-L-fuconate hydrolase